MSFFETQNLNHNFGGVQAIKELSFSADQHQITAIIGPNGAGKTTLFNLISGVFKPAAGEIIFKGQSITGIKPFKLARIGIRRTFQNIKLFASMTVLENVAVGAAMEGKNSFSAAMLKLPIASKENAAMLGKAFKALEFVGLSSDAYSYAIDLPYGKQKLVEIARAIVAKPDLLLLDEPAAGLNHTETNFVAQLIVKLKEQGITVLVVEHDMELIMNISDKIVVLDHGALIATGTPREVQSNPEVIKIYLGED